MALEMLPAINRMKLFSLIPGLAQKPVEQVYGPRTAEVLKRRDVRKMTAKGTLTCFKEGFATA